MNYSKVRKVKSPNRGTQKSAGIDFYTPDCFIARRIIPGESLFIASGIRVKIPEGYMLQVANKSGIAIKGLLVGAEIVDEDYQGELHINVWNVSNVDVYIVPGQKIVQMILIPVSDDEPIEVDDDVLHASKTERGFGGFGSTGLN